VKNFVGKALLIGLFVSSGSAGAKGHIKAQLERDVERSSTALVLSVSNDGDAPIAMLRQQIPLVLINGKNLPSNLFRLRSADDIAGGEVPYSGLLSRIVNAQEADYVVLAPGEVVRVNYDPAYDYQLEPSRTYQINYLGSGAVRPSDRLGRPRATVLPVGDQELIESNVVEFNTPADFVRPRAFHARFPNRPGFDNENGESEALFQALLAAENIMAIAMNQYEAGEPPLFFRPNTFSVNGGNYTWWFNAYQPEDEGYIRGTLKGLRRRIDRQSFGTNPVRSVEFVNGRGAPSCTASPGTAAVAHTGSVVGQNTYEILICPDVFFGFPQYPDGIVIASQGGMLLHEMSHFADLPSDANGWLFGTVDFAPISNYTREGAHGLAGRSRTDAMRNAANYEFYAENKPAH
jgi:hypothetical protein